MLQILRVLEPHSSHFKVCVILLLWLLYFCYGCGATTSNVTHVWLNSLTLFWGVCFKFWGFMRLTVHTSKYTLQPLLWLWCNDVKCYLRLIKFRNAVHIFHWTRVWAFSFSIFCHNQDLSLDADLIFLPEEKQENNEGEKRGILACQQFKFSWFTMPKDKFKWDINLKNSCFREKLMKTE